IKTYRGDLSGVRDNHRALHWAQARMYGHLLCQARSLQTLRIALAYVNVATEEETVLSETRDAPWRKGDFETQSGGRQAWAGAVCAGREGADPGAWRWCTLPSPPKKRPYCPTRAMPRG